MDHDTCGRSGHVQSDVRSLNTAIAEGPIDRHKSRLALRETGYGLTGTYSGGSLDRIESVPEMVTRVPCACRPERSLSTGPSRALVKNSPFTLSGNVVDVF